MAKRELKVIKNESEEVGFNTVLRPVSKDSKKKEAIKPKEPSKEDAPTQRAPFKEGSTIDVKLPRTQPSASSASENTSEEAPQEASFKKIALVANTKEPQKNTKEPKETSLSDSFKRAIQHLAPQALGMLVGGLMGGEEGAVAGYDRGRQWGKDLHELAATDSQEARANMNAETQRMFAEANMEKSRRGRAKTPALSKTWVDSSGAPVLELDGLPVDREGKVLDPKSVKRYEKPISALDRAKIANFQDVASNRQFRQGQANEADAQRVLKDLRGTEEYKTAAKELSSVPTIRNLIKDAVAVGGQSLSMLGPKVAKGIAGEVGVLTQHDVTRYVQDPSLVGSLRDSLIKLKSGKLSEVSAENLSRLLDIMEKSANDKINRAIDREATLFSRRAGIPKEEARMYIDETAQVSETPTGAPQNTGGPSRGVLQSLFSKYKN